MGERVSPRNSLLRRPLSWLAPLGPLAPVAGFACVYFLLFSITRLILSLYYMDQLAQVDGAWWLLPIGLRMDSMLLSAVLLFPALLLLLLPNAGRQYWQPLMAGILGLMGATLLYFEAMTFTFISEYGSRPNHLFLEYMGHPDKVLSILLVGFKLELAIGLLLILAGGWWTTRLSLHMMRNARQWSYPRRLLATPLVLLVLTLGARSSLSDSPANLGVAAFSGDNLVNELALNSSYAVAYSAYSRITQQWIDVAQRYGEMPRDEVIRRVRQQMLLPPQAFDDPDIPLAHRQFAREPLARPRNLVIILSESLSAEFIGTLGGLPLSPQFDALAEQGVLFERMFATGKRTNRGLESLVTGALPIPLISAIKLRLAQSDFFTLPALLKAHGYHTSFVYGGDSNFDNMRHFLRYNGVDHIIEQKDIPNPRFRNHWGLSDEDTFAAADRYYRQQGEGPFASIILTLSNHEPFEFPTGDYPLYEQPPATRNNAAQYADHALGQFFRRARSAPYYDNTVFLVVADHGVEISGRGLIPAAKYHIPALILAPGLTPRRIGRLASQIDLPPTVLGLLGIDTRHPMPGRDLLALPEDAPGRAIYHLGTTHAYQVDDRVLISRPDLPARQYRIHRGALTEMPLDTELAKDALAHILLPDLLHRERRYRLPRQPGAR